ncbi:MAG: AMMECR1 domain-containing protein [Firmicutes bacterium]|nr:AMMECR1 domain-containing protein [Bacillota bacterium]
MIRHLYPVMRYSVLLLFLLITASSAFASSPLDSFKAVKNKTNEKIVCGIARQAVEAKIRKNAIIQPPSGIPGFLKQPSAVFVTIIKKDITSGCMGTLVPREPTLAAEIIRSAIMASTADYWYESIREKDLGKLKYLVTIPGPLRPVGSKAQLSPKTLGLLVRKGSKSALLLPGEALTPEWQIYECRRKAGIPQNEKVEMFVFETVSFGPY